jgi:predicted kinase
MKILKLIRGLPGSGKSTLAEDLFQCFSLEEIPCRWVEADMYFIKDGTYQYDKTLLSAAHRWCQDEARKAMENEIDVVLVSNTFTQKWEAEPYLEMAKQYGYNVQVIALSAEFGSIHSIPEEAYNRMKGRWEHDIL